LFAGKQQKERAQNHKLRLADTLPSAADRGRQSAEQSKREGIKAESFMAAKG